jgi:GNAT superfamily N-acetyltransferase
MPHDIHIRPAKTARDRQAIVTFPWHIYRNDPLWVPPLISERLARLDPERNPFFQTGEAQPLLAYRQGKRVGTIVSAIDHRSNRHLGEKVAVFGFFEVIEDYAVAEALFHAAADWARQKGMKALRGPFNFTASDEPGLLVEGRDTPPVILMGHNPPYYVDFVQRFGFVKLGADSLAFRAWTAPYEGDPGRLPPKLLRVAEAVRKRGGFTLRHGRLNRWDEEIELAFHIYNGALSTLPRFVPLTRADFERQARALEPLLDPDFVLFAEINGQPVGFALGLPDINQAIRHANGGRYPWDWLKLWWYSRRIDCLSFKIIAVLPEYRGRGIDVLFYLEMARQMLAHGYRWMDMSLTAEDNLMPTRIATRFGAEVYKRYRIFQLAL